MPFAENAVNIMTVHAAKGLEFPIVFVPDMGTGFREKFPPIMIGDNPLMVGVRVPNSADNYEMTESAVLVILRELQRQKERAERKRLLYVALTRARDHLFMSGTAPSDTGLSLDIARSRIEWVFTSLSVTGDAISAGGLVLPSGLRLSIVSDPLAIPPNGAHSEGFRNACAGMGRFCAGIGTRTLSLIGVLRRRNEFGGVQVSQCPGPE